AVMSRIDLDRLVGRIDVDAIVDRVDIDRIVSRLDLDAIVDQVDVERVIARVDLDAVVAGVDLDAAVARVDLNAAADRIDVDRVVERVDVDAIAASLDIDAIVAQSTKGVMGRFTDLLRRQVVGIDEIAMRTVNRLLRRDYESLPVGPPLAAGHDALDADGVTMSGRYAGPVSRIGALGLDVFLISSTFTLLLAGVVYLVDVLFGATVDPAGGWVPGMLLLLYGFTYFWLSQSLTGRTISQALVGIKVIRNDGEPLSPGAAAIRTIVLPFSFLLFGVGALMALVDRRRRALQDVAAGSSVVYDWGDRPAALPAPLTRFLDRKAASIPAASKRR
ncbi:MAG: RDD family protein, partial [Ilumatobacteraceae bacterium]